MQNLKKFLQQIQSFEGAPFLAQNGPFPQMRIFSEHLLMSLVPFIYAYLQAKNQSQILYLLLSHWRLNNTEISLAESHFWL